MRSGGEGWWRGRGRGRWWAFGRWRGEGGGREGTLARNHTLHFLFPHHQLLQQARRWWTDRFYRIEGRFDRFDRVGMWTGWLTDRFEWCTSSIAIYMYIAWRNSLAPHRIDLRGIWFGEIKRRSIRFWHRTDRF